MLGDIHLLRKQIYGWFSAHPNIKLSGFQFKPKKKNIILIHQQFVKLTQTPSLKERYIGNVHKWHSTFFNDFSAPSLPTMSYNFYPVIPDFWGH